MLKDNWIVCDDVDDLTVQLAHQILIIANKSIGLNNEFKIVLAGGRSFTGVYDILKESKSDWSKWRVYIGDERCLPMGDRNRNDYIINKSWLYNGRIPKERINFIPVELGIQNALRNYNHILKDVANFDLTLLGMGEDGHTASLFPDSAYSNTGESDVLIERNSPKLPRNRISMSYSRLNRSKHVFKAVCGHAKANALNLWLHGGDLPISKIHGHNEKVFVCKNALTAYYLD